MLRGEHFFGALFANNVYLIHSQSGNRKKDLKKKYDANFAAGCSKSLSCEKVCPAGISTLSSMLKMNRNRQKSDAYDYEEWDAVAVNSFHGEYMLNYSWAEFTTGMSSQMK